jgi:26S proteasome regulatory subunit N3
MNWVCVDKKNNQMVVLLSFPLSYLRIDILCEVAVLVRAAPTREVRLVQRALRHSAAVRRSLGPRVLETIADHALANAPAERAALGAWLPTVRDDEPVPDLSEEEPPAVAAGSDDAAAPMDVDDDKAGKAGKDDKGKKADGGKAGKDAKGEGSKNKKSEKADAAKAAATAAATAAALAAARRRMPADPSDAQIAATPEVRAYLQLLTLVHLVDLGDAGRAVKCAEDLVAWVTEHARHTMDPLAARTWFYLVRAVELTGVSTEPLRPRLLAAYRTSCLRHDSVGQAVLLNLLVRGYLASGLYDQADKLVAKTTFPADASPNQLARHLHYVGRIRAVQLDYTEAHHSLSLALRKSPQVAAHGFRLLTTKLSIVVQLLMGDIPDRAVFHSVQQLPANTSSTAAKAQVGATASTLGGMQSSSALGVNSSIDVSDLPPSPPGLPPSLVPYFHLAKSVRDGSRAHYDTTLAAFAPTFIADATETLVARLGAAVLKAALRRMTAAYSAIPLADAAERLGVAATAGGGSGLGGHAGAGGEAAAAAVVARAARDGVADARVRWGDGGKGRSVVSLAPVDMYTTSDPQRAFHERILFANSVRADARKAMRYRDEGGMDETEAEERRRRAAEEEEFAQEIAEEEDDEGEF